MSQIPLQFGERLAFYLSSVGACPYLDAQSERKLFTYLIGHPEENDEINSLLTQSGFRRSQDILYRPACGACGACVPVRLPVDSFAPSRGQKKLMRKMKAWRVGWERARATPDLYAFFQAYLWARHGDGEMARMDYAAFEEMIEGGGVSARLLKLYEGAELQGCMLVDKLRDGCSAVYSFFDPREPRRSLGTALVLALTQKMKAEGLPYLYLGYRVEACAKMAYKAKFRPLEGLSAEGWKPLEGRE